MINIYLYAAIFCISIALVTVGCFLYGLWKDRNRTPHPRMLQEGVQAIFNETFKGFTAHKNYKEGDEVIWNGKKCIIGKSSLPDPNEVDKQMAKDMQECIDAYKETSPLFKERNSRQPKTKVSRADIVCKSLVEWLENEGMLTSEKCAEISPAVFLAFRNFERDILNG